LHVICGKLIVTPIENSFLTIVPIDLWAAGENLPQIKQVVAVTVDKVVREPPWMKRWRTCLCSKSREQPSARRRISETPAGRTTDARVWAGGQPPVPAVGPMGI